MAKAKKKLAPLKPPVNPQANKDAVKKMLGTKKGGK